ncbi:S1C family serine protease [Mycolicibacterium septicum]|uniref:S1C family serine protease n=1 Tax=Mycolicibacterium septicum TaxID=98668 RepID=UPI001AF32D7C|nr:S1C family serine protease [Mycolicibacterium septicum]QRY53828.1 serine protease [Mycolicibacterium septicum]
MSSSLRQFSNEIADLAARVSASTATVTGLTRDFDEPTGSAWLYDDEHLVTNDHVVENLLDKIEVRLPEQRATQARLVGRDALTDLAVLRIDRQSVLPLRLSSTSARLGELCLALGSPLGDFPESISIGIVSGLKRSLPTADGSAIFDVIQTDCAINPGNSGGPLVDVDGLVIGVNTAGISDADGIGFAVPADTVADIVPELISHGRIERPSLGIGVALRQVESLPAGEGLVVTSVREKAAGAFERGDVILTVDERHVHNQNSLLRALRRRVADRRIEVVVLRGGQQISLDCIPRSKRSDELRG